MEFALSVPVFQTTNPIIKRITEYTIMNMAEEITLEDLAKVGRVSTFYLCRLFKKDLGLSPMKWLWLQRTMAAAAYLLTDRSFSLTDVAFSCGFTSSAHFSRLFKSTYGVTPSHYKRLNRIGIENYPGTGVIPKSIEDDYKDNMILVSKEVF
ncbi:MAG: AraC family transcriptional regulator [Deltaproteobacteria bacterium]|nr:MAG: AraC family transcriptional regulator [Deltaproteobacteria bacterium]TNF31949.1 MAG: AraC family transcriptional regulator [Deltaproteobacteria bacterium]